MKIAGRKAGLTGDPVDTRLSLEGLVIEAAASARPPERLSVSEAAARYRYLNNPGSYVGPWLNETVPYLVEPMDVLQSPDFTGMVFAGPAQTGKTDMALNWLTYSVMCDPADLMIVQTSNITARDFSIRRIDRLHRHSPEVGRQIAPGQGDNVFDKSYRNGMLMTLSWPSINELSGKPIPRLWLTDFDRMPEDVDGEGNAFDLARKRATTFRSFGMCAAESSPGFVVDNPKWKRRTPHEAPPTRGILSLYNRGDRRRWYWRCIDCHNWFEPSFSIMQWPDSADFMESAEQATVACPHCGGEYHHEPRDGRPGKHELNRNGRWLRDGMRWVGDQQVGTPIRSSIASFWMKGVAAAFSDWKTLVFNYLTAEEEYAQSQSEEALKTTINTDQGEPYLPKARSNDRSPEVLQARAFDFGQREVPAPVRFLIACIDLQKNSFVVQIHGIADNKDIYVIDRFSIRKSKRVDEDGERLWVNPGAHPEDWLLLVEEVLNRSYPLADGSGRHMAIRMTMCDSAGREGFTANAYSFFKWLRSGPDEKATEEEKALWKPNLAARFMLLKGASTVTAPRLAVTFPDSQRKDRNAGARGEIPVAIINTNTLKDMVDKRLDRVEPGGRFCFSSVLDANFFIELTVEIKDARKGVWVNPKDYRNESWDLLTYCLAATLLPTIGLDRLSFAEPPSWAAEWDHNDLVFNPEKSGRPFEAVKGDGGLAALAKLAEDLA